MSLTLDEWTSRFKKFGKLIKASQFAEPVAVQLMKTHVALVDQPSTTDTSEEFDVNDQVVTPLGSSVRALRDNIVNFPAQVKSAADVFLRQFIALDLGLSRGASYTSINNAIRPQMLAVGATVAPSGDNGSNADGIAMWFATNFAIVLPQSDTPSIPDSYVTDTVL
jgi:hypothetical protein